MARLAAGWHWRMGLGTCATGFASAVGRLTFRPVAGRSGAWYIKGDAVHFRGRFFNGTQTKYVTSRRSPPKHWPSQWHTSAAPPWPRRFHGRHRNHRCGSLPERRQFQRHRAGRQGGHRLGGWSNNYAYDPYGNVTVYDPTWATVRTSGSSYSKHNPVRRWRWTR